ncbi:MAG: MATE family efflux transporter [Prevotella sp.]|jgi:putative MATE family efflux protein|nr:MATE family efflux transporter [Prevotella sp.]
MLKTANIDELENKKISKLLWQYALPAIIGTSVNAVYSVIDRFFLGHGPDLGKIAVTAIGIALPVMIVLTAVGMLVGAGAASRISIFMGRGEKNTAEKIIGNAFLLTIVLTGGTTLLLYIFLDPILLLVGATHETFDLAGEFLNYYLPGSIFLTMCFSFNNMMRASGYPRKAMYTMLISVIANIVLAPVFIFVMKLGMKGVAIATVISMFIGLCFVMHHFLNKNSLLRLRISNIRFDREIVRSVISIGLAPFFIQLAAATVTLFMIHQLKEYGKEQAIAAYTITNTLVMLVIMALVGLTQGMQPIVGYNYGAKNIKRVKDTLDYTIKAGVGIGAIGLVFGFVLPELLAKAMASDLTEDEIKGTARALRMITVMLPLVGFQIVVTNFFQSIGMAGQSIFLSLTRQFLFLIPALYLLPSFFDLDGVWLSFPAADFLSTLLTAAMFVWQINKFKKMEATL